MNALAFARIGENKSAAARCFKFYQNVEIFSSQQEALKTPFPYTKAKMLKQTLIKSLVQKLYLREKIKFRLVV